MKRAPIRLLILALTLALSPTRADAPGAGLLVEPEWLASHLDDPGLRVVDMRGADAYAAGHLPGAVRLEEGSLRSAEDRLTYLPKPEAFAQLIGKAGISNQTRVVAYDDQGGR